MIPSPRILVTGIQRPEWLHPWLWSPTTWICHGALQAGFYFLDPGFGWGMLFMWYYRDRGQHAQKHINRWGLDAIMDVSTPVLVQVGLTIWGMT